MTKLQAPLGEHLTARVDESAVQRIWSGVRARRAGSLLVRRPSLPSWIYGTAVATVAALVAALLITRALSHGPEKLPQPTPVGPLLTRAGAPLGTLGGDQTSRDELSDGSSIQLDAGSRLEVLENSSKVFASALRRGRGTFSVTPGGPRRWTVEAGLATVEVVGTRFTVSRGETAVEVEVLHGIVLVRSDLVTDRVQRLSAGQHLSIRLPGAPAASSRAPADSPAAPLSSTLPKAPASASATSVESLLGLANEQRRSGDLSGAERSLRRALSEQPRGPQTALAAFTLGKLLQDAARRPSEAAVAFEQCLAAAPPSALAEDALFRLAEAHAAAGERQAANDAARRYRIRYPDGRYARDVGRWLVER